METLKQLTGNSGCSINIIKQSSNTVVRKISKNIEYNDRLINQTEKQICFNHPYIKTPQIFNTGQINDLFFVDMEYISGITLDQYIKTSTPKTTIKIITSIFRHVR